MRGRVTRRLTRLQIYVQGSQNISKYFKMVQWVCGSVVVNFSIYLNSLLYVLLSSRCVSGPGQPDLAQQCDVHYKFCEKLFNTLVEHRYAHEYGEVTVPLPSAPKTPRSGRPQSSRQKEKFLSPKDLFENALNASSKTGLTETQNSAESPKDLFESALKASCKADSVEKYNGASPKDLFDSTVRASDRTGAIDNYDRGARSTAGNGSVNAVMNNSSDPRALFDQALRSTESGAIINTSRAEHLTNG